MAGDNIFTLRSKRGPYNWSGWAVPAVAALAFLYPRHEWVRYLNVNETARIYLTQAIVDHRVLSIDQGIARFGDVHDKAECGGHFYCDKPIGLSLIAVPAYAGLKVLGEWTGHDWSLGELRYILTIVCVSVPSLLMLCWLRKYWSQLGGDELIADFAILAYSLGTIAFTYSTQFMGHQLSAVLVVAHFAVARRLRASPARISWVVAAGLLTGFGAITEYFTAFLHAIILLTYALRLRPRAYWPIWFTAAGIGICPLLVYNSICFGGAFKMAYAHESLEAFKTVHSAGFMGVTIPSIESLWGLLFSAFKGLFFISPFLGLGVVGVLAINDRRVRGDVVLCGACTLVIVYLATSIQQWPAGWTIGPRHMVSMLPFMMTLVVLAVSRRRWLLPWFVGLSMIGIVFVGIATLTLPAFEANLENPINTQAMFLIRAGLVSPNLGEVIGLRGAWSVAPLAIAILAGLVVLVTRLRRTGRSVLNPAGCGAALLAYGWCIAVCTYQPEHPALRTLFQGRVLGLVDQLPQSAQFLERSMDMLEELHDSQANTIAVEDAAPHLMTIYRELGDIASAQRLKARVERLRPGG